jgi:hypothetical protein
MYKIYTRNFHLQLNPSTILLLITLRYLLDEHNYPKHAFTHYFSAVFLSIKLLVAIKSLHQIKRKDFRYDGRMCTNGHCKI